MSQPNTWGSFQKEYLQIIPEFRGQKGLLSEFVATSEQLITEFYNYDNPGDFRNTFLIKSIKNKILGEAAEAISSYNITSWIDLKNALFATYEDKRDLQTLIIELCGLRQGKLKPIEFYAKIQENLNVQIAYIRMHHSSSKDLINNSQKLALRIFLKHLNNPLGDYLSTRNPESLADALYVLTNDFNVNDRFKYSQEDKPRPPVQMQPNQSRFHFQTPPRTQFSPRPQQFSSPTRTPPSAKTPFRQPVFNNSPTPMSISTRNTYTPRNNPRGNFNLTSHESRQITEMPYLDEAGHMQHEYDNTSDNEEPVQYYDDQSFLDGNASTQPNS